MKNILMLLMAFVLFTSCDSSDDDNMNMRAEEETPKEVAKGDFVSDAHPTMGMVTVNEDQSKLTIKNFKTDDGPKLLMYLSTDVDSQDFVNLGDLKGLEGDYEYDIPDNTDLTKYKFLVVWCVDFSVSFGHAELK